MTTYVPAGNDIEVDFDNVRLTESPIPETDTFAALAGLLALAVALIRRR